MSPSPIPPKYRKHSLRDLGFVAFKKKRIYFRGAYNSDQSVSEYQDFVRANFPFAAIANPVASPRQDTEVVFVADLAFQFMDWAKKYYPPGRRGGYQNIRSAMNWLMKFSKGIPVKDFGPLRLQELQSAMITWRQPATDKKLERSHSRSYINQTISFVRQAFKWGVSREKIPPSIHHGLLSVPELKQGRFNVREAVGKKPVKWPHVAATLTELSPTITAMVLFQWMTGARGDSICRATPSQFDRDTDIWYWRPKHKMQHTGKVIVIPIGPRCQELLRPLLESREPDEPLFRPGDQRKNRRYGRTYSSLSYAQAIDRAVDRANAHREDKEKIPHWSPHQLRHAKAQAVRSEYGVEAAQAVLTHESLDATEIYSERLLGLAVRVARETS